MSDNNDHFGTPYENVQAAKKWGDKCRKKHNYYTHVPTRREIETLPHEELSALLIGWMEHSPTESIPSRMQIALVRDVLLNRLDANKLKKQLDMCKHYIDGD